MQTALLDTLAAQYGWHNYQISPIESGLINHTYKVVTPNGKFVLQQVNTNVFKQPLAIDANMQLLKHQLANAQPNYLCVTPIAGIDGNTLHQVNHQYFRAFRFIEGSHTVATVNTPKQAYEAAKAFAKFTAVCNAIDANALQETLPNFHNLPLRYQQFEAALHIANDERLKTCKTLIEALQTQQTIVNKYEAFIAHPNAIKRVTHHDTKISNVLFNEADEAICAIDLDTVMPGYFISDVGDMIRTYVCPVSEEESDLSKIIVRKNYLQAIQAGYYSHMQQHLTAFEQAHFFFAGEALIYMQALRFCTDYLQNDVYYPIKYPHHNLVRANNQMQLLLALQDVL
ncbi:MAG: aminoglycoside phosphotransferase family protein [Flavobacterium sp.]|nr:aminoglycoside phosphotransferase family protein [Flavobacterium sp.]